MKRFITEDDVEEVVDYLRDNANNAAKAHAERTWLERYTKSLLAIIMKEHPHLSVNAQEREAWADPRMIEHQQAVKLAVLEDERHRFRLESSRAVLSAWQTMHKVELAMQI